MDNGGLQERTARIAEDGLDAMEHAAETLHTSIGFLTVGLLCFLFVCLAFTIKLPVRIGREITGGVAWLGLCCGVLALVFGWLTLKRLDTKEVDN